MILELLLRKVRDGVASVDEAAAARALVATDPRVPDEIREGLWDDDPAGDAAGLLALLGADDLDLAGAVAAEAGAIDAAALEFPFDVPLADAVRAEGGTIDIADDVGRILGHSRLSLALALAAEVGPVELWPAVASAIGARTVEVADAVRAEAGPVDLWRAVEREIDPKPAAIRPVNNNRWWGAGVLAAAAAAMLFVAWPSSDSSDELPLVLAQSSETRVEELVASDRVTVMQLEGDEGALILWIEDNEPGEVF